MSRQWNLASGKPPAEERKSQSDTCANFQTGLSEPNIKSCNRKPSVPFLMIKKKVDLIRHKSAAKMQRSWLTLSLLGPLITISAASPILQTVNTSLDLFENGILAAESSNNTLRIDTNTFPALNASTDVAEIECFPPRDRFGSVVMDDYYGAVDQILVRADAMIPQEWILGPTPAQSYISRTGRCKISLWASTNLRTPPFPVIYVAHVAAVIAQHCVTEAHGYRGGMVRLNDLGKPLIAVGARQSRLDGSTAQT